MNTDLKNIKFTKEFLTFDIIAVADVKDILKLAEGKNQKQTLIICPLENDKEDFQDLLKNILKAVNFEIPQDILLLKLTQKQSFSFSSLHSLVEIKNVLVFGFEPRFLGLNWQLPKYHPFLHQERNYLFADSLEKLHADKSLKMQLWKCLQALFQ